MNNDKGHLLALKSAIYFFIFGFFWILFSDRLLINLQLTEELENKLQMYKGWFFISLTTILIYLLVRQQLMKIIKLTNKLSVSEKSLSVVLENIGEGIITIDLEEKIVSMNSVAEMLTGVDESTAKGQALEQILHLADDEDINIVIKLLLKTGIRSNIENPFKLVSADNQTYKIISRSDKIIDAYGNWMGTIIAFRDITDIFERDKAIKEREEQYKVLVQTTHDLIWKSSIDGIITYVDDTCIDIYGYTANELIGRPFSDFVEKKYMDLNSAILQENLSKGNTTIQFETEITKKGGQKVYLVDNVIVNFDEKGNITGLTGASKDVTANKLDEMAIRESKERLELALQGGELGLWDIYLDTGKVYVNNSWNQIIGNHNDNLVYDFGKFLEIVYPEDQPGVKENYNDCIDGKIGLLNIEYRIKQADDKPKWILSRGKIVERNESGTPVRMSGTIVDITAKKDLEQELLYWLELYSSFIKYASEGIYLCELSEPIPVNLSHEEQIKRFYRFGYIKTCNDAFARMYGFEFAEEIINIKLSTLHGSVDVPENINMIKKFIDSGYRMIQEMTKEIDRNGNVVYFSNNAVGILENEKWTRIWGSQFNITDQIEMHQRLEDSEFQYKLLFQSNPVPLIIYDFGNFSILSVNNAAELLFGYSHEEFLNLKIWDIRPDFKLLTTDELRKWILDSLLIVTEYITVDKNGKQIPVEIKRDQLMYNGRKAILSAINDITAVKKAEQRVIESVVEAENRERKRISKEIHDSLGQYLTAASLNFNAITGVLERYDPQKALKFQLGMDFLNAAIDESRNIAHNLMPKAIEDFGLVVTLGSLFNQIEKTSGLKISFFDNLDNQRLSQQIEFNLFRITQEAINNTIKHSGANHIFIQIMLHQNELIYTFEDDGKGFNVPVSVAIKNGIGIAGINNRVKAMNGTFEIDSSPGRGTAITIDIPV